MSLYNMMNGANPAAGWLLDALSLEPASIGRFRDIWTDGELKTITILTRTGGGNREYHESDNAMLQAHPQYLSDEDDDFDCTYAKFHFTFPEEKRKEFIAEIERATDKEKVLAIITKDNRKKWDEVFAVLSKENNQCQ